jgi:hypothetical protein
VSADFDLILGGEWMNRLVAALRLRPEIVSLAAEQDLPTFGWLREVLGDDLLGPSEREWIYLQEEQSTALGDAYLVPIAVQRWDRGLQLAEERPRIEAAEWITMVPGASGEVGLTVPDDASDEERISLFAGPPDRPRQITVNLGGPQPLLGQPGHCTLPILGECSPGICGGCQTRRVIAPEEGLICLCPDLV